jgi:hypothetical protein
MSLKILAGAVPPPAAEKEFVKARPKGGKSNFTKKKPGLGFYGKK